MEDRTHMRSVAAQAAFDVMLLGISLPLVWSMSWGEWIINRDGVEFRPERGPSRSLPWNDVEWVLIRRDRLVLRGRDITIRIAWEDLPRREVNRGREYIEKRLGDSFDMVDYPLFKLPLGPRELVAWSNRFIGTSIAMAVLCLSVGSWIVNREPLPSAWRLNVFCIRSLASLLGPFCWAEVRHQRKQKLLHPEWPWRIRRRAPDQG